MANTQKVMTLEDTAKLIAKVHANATGGAKFEYDNAKGEYGNIAAYMAAHKDGKVYGVKFPKYTYSNTPTGVKTRDNANLTIEISTNAKAGRDDYAPLNAFRTWDVNATVDDDGAGESHPVSDAQRWWWTQRRFHAGSVCSGQYDDKYVNYAYTCTSDGKWEGSDTDAIQSQPFWTTKETSFPIPEGGGPSSTTDPQQTVSQAYNTVLLPMDDGNWHVTVYCPAALDASLLDKDANELDPDQVKAGDEAYTVISATGYGTVQHPCRTVEVVVGGQKPFWSLRNTQ